MGSHFGTGGADPCVGVIIICNDNGKIYGGVFNFYTGDDGVSTISQYEWKEIKTAYVFRGNNKANLSFYLYRFLKKEKPRKMGQVRYLTTSTFFLSWLPRCGSDNS